MNELPEHEGQMLSPVFWGKNQNGVSQNYSAENQVLPKMAFTYFFPS